MSKLNEVIFKNVILAILKAQPGIGSVQLRKSLIITDATYYALFGKSLTGTRYIKFHYGPVPDYDAFKLLNKMYYEENLIDILEEAEGNVTKNSYFAMKEPEPGIFTEDEYKIIRFAANIALKYSASRLSDMTHDDVFNNTPMRGEIPLDKVCTISFTDSLDTPNFTEEEKLELTQVLSSNEIAQYNFV